MDVPEETTDDLLKRLRRVEGQVRGIQQMLLDGRECRDVVTQISAASKALDQAGFKLVASGLTYCLEDPQKAAREGFGLDDVQKMFMKLASSGLVVTRPSGRRPRRLSRSGRTK